MITNNNEELMGAIAIYLINEGFVSCEPSGEMPADAECIKNVLAFERINLTGEPDAMVELYNCNPTDYEECPLLYVRFSAIPDDPDEICQYTAAAVQDAYKMCQKVLTNMARFASIEYKVDSYLEDEVPVFFANTDGAIVITNAKRFYDLTHKEVHD